MADVPSPSPLPWQHGSTRSSSTQPLVVDCDTCRVRGPACADCVVSVLLGTPPAPLHWESEQVAAFAALAGAGLVPPLRLVTPVDPPEIRTEPDESDSSQSDDHER